MPTNHGDPAFYERLQLGLHLAGIDPDQDDAAGLERERRGHGAGAAGRRAARVVQARAPADRAGSFLMPFVTPRMPPLRRSSLITATVTPVTARGPDLGPLHCG